jgi:putative N6-adenine-specific DNA methylase
VAGELPGLGATAVHPGRGMVEFQGDRVTLVRCCLGLRSAARLLVPLAEGPTPSREALYALAGRIAWEKLIPQNGTIGVTVAGAQGGAFRNTHFAAQVVKDAVVDRAREKMRWRPRVETRRPDLPINLHLGSDTATISLDAAGAPLSRRGYRTKGGPAALNPALAAGLLLLAGYDGSQPLLDPMTGTGTFAIEAALIATRTPPGLHRGFACERWPGFGRPLFDRVRRDAETTQRSAPAPITGLDHDRKAIAAARENCGRAGMNDHVELHVGEATMLSPPAEGSLIVINPPYGHRLGETSGLEALYSGLGDRLKTGAAGCTAWILAGNRELSKRIGLKPARRVVVFNGPIECRWLRFDLYEGSRR